MKSLGAFNNFDRQAVAVLHSVLSLPHTQKVLLGIAGLGVLTATIITIPEIVYLGVALLVILLIWCRPELGMLAIIFVTSSFLPADIVDLRLAIGGGLELRDLVLLGMVGLLVFRGLVYKNLSVPWWPVGALLLVFLGFAVMSAGYALFYRGVEVNWAFNELRDLGFYVTFFLTAWILKEQRQLSVLIVGLFVLADLTVGVLIGQQFLGMRARLLTGMAGTDWQIGEQTAAAGTFGGVRILPPGIVLMYFMMAIALCLAVFTKQNRRLRVFGLLQFVMLSLGLLLTYTRAQWVATVIVMGLVSIVYVSKLSAQDLIRRLLPGAAVLLLALSFALLFASELADEIDRMPLINSLVVRALNSLEPSERLQVSTLEWRAFETEEAMHALREQPLLGVGLGNAYRDVTFLRGEAAGRYHGSLVNGSYSRFTRYVHSSYVYIAVKMGLPALICFMGFCVASMIKSWQLFRNLPDGRARNIILAIMAGFMGLLVWASIHEDLVRTTSTAVVGLMFGTVAGIQYIHRSTALSIPGHDVA